MRAAQILVIDDDATAREALDGLLAREGYSLHFAPTGQAGLERAHELRPDAILLDVMLPEVDGFEICRRLRRDPGLLEVPVILITALNDRASRLRGFEAGADEFLSKPFDAAELRARLRTMSRLNRYRRLTEQRQRFESLIQLSPNAILVVDAHDVIRHANHAAQSLLQSSGLVGAGFARWLKHGSLRLWEEGVARLLAAEHDVARLGELEIVLSNGPPLPVQADAGLSSWDGEVAVQLLLRDLTDEKRAQEEAAHREDNLRQTEKLATMGSLLAGLAHELNNPLAVVLGQASLLARRMRSGPEAERASKIMTAAERCGRIVTSFLQAVRKRPREPRKVDVRGVVEEACALLEYQLRTSNIELVSDFAPSLPRTVADPHELQQVVVNLLTNAIHAVRGIQAPRRINVTGRAHDDGRAVVVEVSDNGPGMEPQVRARAFEPFFTTKPAGVGTGLGLHLCRNMVLSSGGLLELESAVGRGTRVRVELPSSGAVTPAPDPGPLSEPEQPPMEPRDILIVDDEPAVADVTRDLLSELGHRARVALSAEEGLRRLEERLPDLLLCDLHMPGGDGISLLREAAQRWPALRSRVAILTGASFRETLNVPNLPGNVPVIDKPIDMRVLLDLIEALPAPGTMTAR